MRILIVSGFPYPHVGGVSSYITTLKDEVSKAGHEVDIVSISQIPPWKQFSLKAAVLPFAFSDRRLGWKRMNLGRIQALAGVLKRTLSEQRYDIVNAQCVWSMNAVLAANQVAKVPVLLTVHGYAASEAAAFATSEAEREYRVQVMTDLERRAYRMAHAVLAVDRRIADHVRALVPGISTVRQLLNKPNALFFQGSSGEKEALRAALHLPTEGFLILCPRRLSPKNGVRYAVEAMAAVQQTSPGCKLIIAGDGEERNELERMVRAKDLERFVLFLGAVAYEQMAELYRAVDCVVIPSVTHLNVQEASSISALEAMAAGVPVVASAIGGLREIIADGQTGILVAERDARSLAAAVLRLKADSLLCEEFKGAALAFVRQHSATWFPHYEEAIHAAIVQGGGNAS